MERNKVEDCITIVILHNLREKASQRARAIAALLALKTLVAPPTFSACSCSPLYSPVYIISLYAVMSVKCM